MQVEAPIKVSDFLLPNGVLIDVRVSDKARLLEQLTARAAGAAGLDAGEVAGGVAKREDLGSTGVGDGVALPHARLRLLRAPLGVLARLSHPIDFDAIDGKPVDIVFLLLLPEAEDPGKGKALACVARALRQPDILRKIRGAPNRDALFQTIIGADEG